MLSAGSPLVQCISVGSAGKACPGSAGRIRGVVVMPRNMFAGQGGYSAATGTASQAAVVLPNCRRVIACSPLFWPTV